MTKLNISVDMNVDFMGSTRELNNFHDRMAFEFDDTLKKLVTKLGHGNVAISSSSQRAVRNPSTIIGEVG